MASDSVESSVSVEDAKHQSNQPSSCGNCESSAGHAKKQPNHDSDKEHEERRKLENRLSAIKHKILVLSGKGGVGKSTVAVNLAVSLAEAGQRVGLLDVDVHGPSVPTLLGMTGYRPVGDGQDLLPIKLNNNLAVMSIGLLVDDQMAAVIWRGPLKFGMIRQFLRDVAWGELDFLIMDAPPGTGDEPLAVAELVGSGAGAVIVTTPQDLAVADVRRSVSFCRELSLPVIGIVENMSGYTCPKCGEVVNIFNAGGGSKLAREMQVPFLGSIPIDPSVAASGDTGKPFTESGMDSPVNDAFTRAAALITDQIESSIHQSEQ